MKCAAKELVIIKGELLKYTSQVQNKRHLYTLLQLSMVVMTKGNDRWTNVCSYS